MTPEVAAKPEKKLGTPYIEVTPASSEDVTEEPKPRRLANLVTSWGPGVAKLKKTGSGQGAVKTRTSPRPQLPPKSDNAVRQQQHSGQLQLSEGIS